MKNWFTLLPIIMLILPSAFSGSVDTLHGFVQYKIKNESMQNTLHEVITKAKDCPYFQTLNKNFYVMVDLDRDLCECRIYPHNITTLCFYRESMKEYYRKDGVCFYDDCYIYIQDHSSENMIDDYFIRSDTIVDLYIDENENFYDHLLPGNVFYDFSYQIQKGVLIRDVNLEDLPHCSEREFDYLVRRGDTWESIANKCGCSEINLREEYREYTSPLPGLLICVEYIFDNEGRYKGVKRPF